MKKFLLMGIVGVAFSLIGCSYVGPNSDEGNWWDDLSRQEIFEATTVVINGTDAAGSRGDNIDKNIEITWALPFELPVCPNGGAFTITWSYDEDFTDPQSVAIDDLDLDIAKGKVAWEKSDVFIYKFSKWFSFSVNEYIVYFKLNMKDHNGSTYSTIVSFMVFPKDKTLRIRTAPVETDAGALNTLYRIDCTQFLPTVNLPEGRTLLFNDSALDDGDLSSSTNVTLDALSLFQMAILTDLSAIVGDEDVKLARYSNTSFCKVKLVTNANGADATLRYAFEDLPLQLLSTEEPDPDGVRRFDYNDVVVYVDIMDGVVN